MKLTLHKNATTTIAIRQIIKESSLSAFALAKKYGISQTTVARWKNSKSVEYKSSRPNNLNITLTPEQEDRICFKRKQYIEKILDFVNKYNFEKKLKSLNYKTPAQFLKENKKYFYSIFFTLFIISASIIFLSWPNLRRLRSRICLAILSLFTKLSIGQIVDIENGRDAVLSINNLT